MTVQKSQFADSVLALDVARKRYPKALLKVIEHGQGNIVVLVDNSYALRFPRNTDAYAQDKYEASILAIVDRKGIAEELPYVLDEETTPSFFVTPFLRGEHVQLQAVRESSQIIQKQIGEEIARFAYALHSALPVDEVKRIREKLKVDDQIDESWEVAEKYVQHYTFPIVEQDRFAKDYYSQWRKVRSTPQVAVHDDLHTENLLFVDGHLESVLDFGDATIGTAEQELRHLYRFNEYTLQSGIEEYGRLAGRSLDIEASKIWAIIQELVAYGQRRSLGQTDHPSFLRAQASLNMWFETHIW